MAIIDNAGTTCGDLIKFVSTTAFFTSKKLKIMGN